MADFRALIGTVLLNSFVDPVVSSRVSCIQIVAEDLSMIPASSPADSDGRRDCYLMGDND